MGVKNKVVIGTGGASGIGKAPCVRFAKEGARAVVVADLDAAGTTAVASAVGGLGANVAPGAEVQQLVQTATERFGRVDVFCSSAGIIARADQEASNAEWQRHWDRNLMAHVYAACAVLPQMAAHRGVDATTALRLDRRSGDLGRNAVETQVDLAALGDDVHPFAF